MNGGLSEFQLIRRFFETPAARDDVSLSVGDDCALLRPGRNRQLAVTLDTLVEGTHFLAATPPRELGYKSLAVSLSDLAAMGAEPAWAMLSMAMPQVEEDWLQAFMDGFGTLARECATDLVGGDTVRSPHKVITVQLTGLLEPGTALRRDGARVGDLICVSGTLGDAALAFLRAGGPLDAPGLTDRLRRQLLRPVPRLDVSSAIRPLAHAAIDISDGLLADLGHVLKASGVGAELERSRLPLSVEVADYIQASGDWGRVLAWGEDYQLCFTLSAVAWRKLGERFPDLDVTCIGDVVVGSGIRFVDAPTLADDLSRSGYRHF